MSSASHLDSILSQLAASKECEQGLLKELDVLLQTANLPAHMARVVAHAREVLDEGAALWLSTPHRSLHNQMPLRSAQTIEGARRVDDLLTRIATGMPI